MSQRSPKFMSIELVMPSNYLILSHCLLLLSSNFPSIRVFSSESALHISWPKYWSFSFSISPSNEYSGLSSFKIEWFGLLTVQGTLKSLLQHHSSEASVLQGSAFFFFWLPLMRNHFIPLFTIQHYSIKTCATKAVRTEMIMFRELPWWSFHTVHGVFKARKLKFLPFPSPGIDAFE